LFKKIENKIQLLNLQVKLRFDNGCCVKIFSFVFRKGLLRICSNYNFLRLLQPARFFLLSVGFIFLNVVVFRRLINPCSFYCPGSNTALIIILSVASTDLRLVCLKLVCVSDNYSFHTEMYQKIKNRPHAPTVCSQTVAFRVKIAELMREFAG
jgi:hypothetical protein